MTIAKPDYLTEDHLVFLDDLRESGEINMYGASAYVETEFSVSNHEAHQITLYWMQTFEERHPE